MSLFVSPVILTGSVSRGRLHSVFAFLPMSKETFYLPFYVNADFVCHISRETLYASEDKVRFCAER